MKEQKYIQKSYKTYYYSEREIKERKDEVKIDYALLYKEIYKDRKRYF